MSWRDNIYQAMKTDPDLSALVGDRIFPDVADGNTTAPYIIYQSFFATGTTSHDGERNTEYPSIEITAFATAKHSAVDVIDKVKAALEGKALSGSSNLILSFDDRSGQYEDTVRMFSETIEFTGHANTN